MRYLLLILLISSCKEKIQHVKNNYFDIAGYFKQEALKMSEAGTGIIKTVVTNDSNEVQYLDSINWMDELRPFIECDINKPAWRNSYKTDSVVSKDAVSIIYKANEDIPVRKVTVITRGGVIQSIEMWKQRKNIYYDISEHYYFSNEGYIINGKQKVRFLEQTEFTITAEFKS